MALKDNFTQAVKGLTGYNGPVEKPNQKKIIISQPQAGLSLRR